MDVVADIDILAERAISPYTCAALNVAEMPYFGTLPNLDIVVDETALVDKERLIHNIIG